VSAENLELVRGGYAHFVAAGDFLDELFDPDFVWDMSTFRAWPERQTYQGLEGAREFMDDWRAAWDDWELELEDLIDAGDDVVALVHQRGRSRATGLETDMEFAMVWTLRDGLQHRMRMYASHDEALAATGLRQ
jgi:ketosteroid isomerase-like protein